MRELSQFEAMNDDQLFDSAFPPPTSSNQAPVVTIPGFSIRGVSGPTDGGASVGESSALGLAHQGNVYSPDGRYIVFTSTASNLVAGDTNGRSDVFVRDLLTGAITRVSTGSNGEQATSFGSMPPVSPYYGSFEASFSPDGTKVIFSSFATNLAPGDSVSTTDIFLKDLVTGQLTRLTEGTITSGTLAGDNAVFSPDGTRVAFWSTSSTLVAGDTNGIADVFVKDLASGAVTRVSTGPGGEQASGGPYTDSRYPVFSPDGQRLMFQSSAALPGQTSGSNHLYIKDLATGALTMVADNLPSVGQAQFSPDGQRVVFVTSSALVAVDTNNRNDVYVKDLVSGTVTLASTTLSGGSIQQDSFDPSFSPDGRSVLFTSNGYVDPFRVTTSGIWLKNLDTNAVTYISHTAGNDTLQGTTAHFAPDGRSILFSSTASLAAPSSYAGYPFLYEAHLGATVSPDGGAGEAYVENAQPSRLLFDIDVTDDNANFGGGTLTLSLEGGRQANDVVSFVGGGNGIFLIGSELKAGATVLGTVTQTAAGLSVALTANVTAAYLETILLNTRFASTGDAVVGGTRTVRFDITDGGGTVGGGSDHVTFTRTVAVTGVNDGPFTGNTNVTLKNDGVYVLNPTDFLYYDLDGNALTSVRVDMGTFNGAAGQLLYDPDGAGPLAAQPVTGVHEYAIGDFAAGRFTFVPVRTFEGYTYFNFTLRDDGGTANGGVDLSNTAIFQLNVGPGNRAPVFTNTSQPANYVEGDNVQTYTRVFSIGGLELRDPDSRAAGVIQSAVLQITGNFHGDQDMLRINANNANLVNAVYNAATGALTLTPKVPLGDVDWSGIIASVEYGNSSDIPSADTRTISVTASDGQLTSLPMTQTLTVTPTDDTPILTADSRAPGRSNAFDYFVEGSGPVFLFPRAVFTDVDGTNLNGAKLTLTRPESFLFTGTAAVATTATISVSGATVSYNDVPIATIGGGGVPTETVFTFNASASLPAMQALVHALAYSNGAELVGPGGTYTLVLRDAAGFASATAQIAPVEVPDAPVLDLNGAAPGLSNSITYSPGQPSTLLAPAVTLTDPDSSFGASTLTVAMLNPSGGDNITVLIGSGPGQVTTDDYGNLVINGQAFGFEILSPTSAKVSFGYGNVSAETINILIRAIGYVNDGNPATYERVVAFTLAQADTVTSLATIRFPGGAATALPTVSPVAVADNFTVSATTATVLAVTANDTPGLGNMLALNAFGTSTLPSGAVVRLNDDGTVTYTPSTTFVGSTDYFVYGLKGGTSALVTVHIAGVPTDPILGTAAVDTLIGSDGDDSLYGFGGDDILSGGKGNDLLDGGAGADRMSGGQDNDTYIVDDGGDLVIEAGGEGVDEVRTALAAYVLPANVERILYTGTGAATLTGNAGDNVLTGGESGDLFQLEQGGNDTAVGGGGNDGFYFGGAMTAQDSVIGGTGIDEVGLQGVYAGLVFSATSLTGVELVTLLAGDDTRFANLGGVTLGYDLTLNDANVAAGAVLAFQANGLRAGEDFTLNAAAETDGRILIYAGFGIETITGGRSDDGFYFGEGRLGAGDRIDGGGGTDSIGLQGNFAGANALSFGAGQLVNVELIALLSGADTRFGGGGSAFSYTLTMSDGNVAAGATLGIQGNALGVGEVLTFDGSAELDGRFTVFGGAGADSLTGGHGADQLFGGAGADRLTGGMGADVLTGGAGNDLFLFRDWSDTAFGAGDIITDFQPGDRIDLSQADADLDTPGDQAFHIGLTADHAGDMLIQYDAASDRTSITLWVNHDFSAAAIIYLAGNHQDLTTADFLL